MMPPREGRAATAEIDFPTHQSDDLGTRRSELRPGGVFVPELAVWPNAFSPFRRDWDGTKLTSALSFAVPGALHRLPSSPKFGWHLDAAHGRSCTSESFGSCYVHG